MGSADEEDLDGEPMDLDGEPMPEVDAVIDQIHNVPPPLPSSLYHPSLRTSYHIPSLPICAHFSALFSFLFAIPPHGPASMPTNTLLLTTNHHKPADFSNCPAPLPSRNLLTYKLRLHHDPSCASTDVLDLCLSKVIIDWFATMLRLKPKSRRQPQPLRTRERTCSGQ